jgi:hypothetical protein
MKTVIHTWTHEFNINQEHLNKYNYYNEKNFYFGLGDLIRSTIKLYYLSKLLSFKLIVDIQLHPIAEFLKIDKHEYSNYVLENKNKVNYVCYGGVEDYITTSNSNILLILTNDFYEPEDIDEDCKNFIKRIFTPTDIFQQFILNKMNKIPYNVYNILHYRINDNEFLNKNEEVSYEMYMNHLMKHKEKNDILITDTKKLKNYMYLHDDIFMFDTKICHLGLSKDSDEVRDTLFEFFLITYASKIKTYCKIHKMSGFVKWVSKVYNIQIIAFNY